MEVLDPRPLSDEIWEEFVPIGFKPPSLAKFDGRKDPYKHVASINIKMPIIRAPNSLKYKLFSGTFRDAVL